MVSFSSVSNLPEETETEVLSEEQVSYFAFNSSEFFKSFIACLKAFSDGFEKALVIGSDIPSLTISVINKAFDYLDTADAVLGPTQDGGYYLIGFSKKTFLPDVFHGIQWSTSSVFQNTIDIFDKSCSKVRLLSRLRDVDTFEDLLFLFDEDRNAFPAKPLTKAFIQNNRLKIFSRKSKEADSGIV